MTNFYLHDKVNATSNKEEKSRGLNTAKRVRRVKADMDKALKCISEFGGPKE